MIFTPTRNFYEPKVKSQYCVGLTYQVDPGNTVLEELVKLWLSDGRVRPAQPTGALIGG